MPYDAARVKSLFLFASDLEQADRQAYLDRECGDDAELRLRVEALLRVNDAATMGHSDADFEFGAAGRTSPVLPIAESGDPTARVGSMLLGKYKLVEEIGEGGMGRVYMAQQVAPIRRAVAVKIIKAGMDSQAFLARFEAERQALALMDHPHIARILDAGATDSGRPFFVMELVKGTPITTFCDERRLTPVQRLELFVLVCQAIQHAHQKGIIHRDIKPSNILIALHDDEPIPKIIDFGVAKATGEPLSEKTLMTGFGAIIGTPEYMSPEQAMLNNLDIDTRSDVYSLGVLLYELLTGSTPVDRRRLGQAAVLEVLRVVREVEATRPSAKLSTVDTLASIAASRATEPAKLSRLMKGELDWIVMKALEKERGRRFQSCADLARDIKCFLTGEVVSARPPSAAYNLSKYIQRHRALMASAASIFTLLCLTVVATSWGMYRAYRLAEQRDEEAEKAKRFGESRDAEATKAQKNAALYRMASRETQEALRSLESNLAGSQYYFQMALARGEANRAAEAVAFLDLVSPADRNVEWHLTRAEYGVEAPALEPRCEIICSEFSPDGNRAAASYNRGLVLTDLSRLQQVWKVETNFDIDQIQFRDDGSHILIREKNRGFRMLDARTGAVVVDTQDARISDKAQVAFGPEETLIVWDGKSPTTPGLAPTLLDGVTRQVLDREPAKSKAPETIVQVAGLRFFSVTPDGSRIVTWSSEAAGLGGRLSIWDSQSGKVLWTKALSDFPVDLAFSPKGSHVLVRTIEDTLQLYQAASGAELLHVEHCQTILPKIFFSPDELRFVCNLTVGGEQERALFDLSRQMRIAVLGKWGGDRGEKVAFCPDGERIFVQGAGDSVEVWTCSGKPIGTLNGMGDLGGVSFSPDGASMISHDHRLWNITGTGGVVALQLEREFEKAKCLNVSSSGRFIATSGSNQGYRHTIALWDAASGKRLWDAPGRIQTGQNVDDSVIGADFSPDSSRLVSVDNDGGLILWETETHKILRTIEGAHSGIPSHAFSADGRSLAVGGSKGVITLCDLVTGAESVSIAAHEDWVCRVKYCPDGQSVVSLCIDGALGRWDCKTGKKLWTVDAFGPHTGASPPWLAIHPDGSKAIARNHCGMVCCVDLSTGRLLWEFRVQSYGPVETALSPNGERLAIHDFGAIVIYDAATGMKRRTFKGQSTGNCLLAFSPDSSRLVSWREQEGIHVWDLSEDEALRALPCAASELNRLVFSSDGAALIAVGRGVVQKWPLQSGAPVVALGRHQSKIQCHAFSNDDVWIVSASDEGVVKLWDVANRKERWSTQLPYSDPISLQFDSLGKRVYIHTLQDQKCVLDAESGELLDEDASRVTFQNGRTKSLDGVRQVEVSGRTLVLRDLQFQNKPEAQKSDRQSAASKIQWHADRVQRAKLEENWYGVAFHGEWLLRDRPEDAQMANELEAAKKRLELIYQPMGIESKNVLSRPRK